MAAGWVARVCELSRCRNVLALSFPQRQPLLSCSFHINSHNGNFLHQSLRPLSPAVRYLVDTNLIDVSQITPSGPKNRLLKGDVLEYLSKGSVVTSNRRKPDLPVKPDQQAAAAAGHAKLPNRTESFNDIQLTSMRKTIAKRLTLSKTTIPYSYSVIDCRMDNLLKMREEMLKENEVRVSVNDLIVKAVGLSLRSVPECNAAWVDEDVRLLQNIDVSIAVATDGGLLTPIIERADTYKTTELSTQIRNLAKKARAGKLQPHEYQGGTFCVSNLGMYGITEFTAIINPPQAAILAVGGVKLVPWVGSGGDEEGVAKSMRVTLSHDCRVIDYELAAEWLTVFKNYIESPSVMGLL